MSGQRPSPNDSIGVSVSTLIRHRVPLKRLLADGEPQGSQSSTDAVTLRARKKLHSGSTTHTPYGVLLKTMYIGNLLVEYMCPFAVLHYMSAQSTEFLNAISACHKDGLGRLCLYMDEVRPGNPFRPGKARAYQAIYWTLLDLPGWLRDRVESIGWFTLMYVKTADLILHGLSCSSIVTVIIHTLWPKDVNAQNLQRQGVILGGHFHLRISFECFLADEKGIKECFCVKGAGGSKPCANCMNCLGYMHSPINMQPGAAHVYDPDMSKFKPHRAATFLAMVAKVKECIRTGIGNSDALQQKLGICYEEGGVIWDPHAASIAKAPTSVFWDMMHCMYASGGIAQFHVNCLYLVSKQHRPHIPYSRLLFKFVYPSLCGLGYR